MKKILTDPLGRKITFEPVQTDIVEQLQSWIEIVLKALKHPEAFITDGSTISDFFEFMTIDENQDRKFEQKLSKKLGIQVIGRDKIIDVARRIKEKHELKLRSGKTKKRRSTVE
jgi:hypothetical protein